MVVTLPGETVWYWAVLSAAWCVLATVVCRMRAAGRIGAAAAWGRGVLVTLGGVAGIGVGVVPTVLWYAWSGDPLAWPSVGEWAWWTGAAGAGIAGAWLTALVIAGDPSRGRRRCPRCWYDMSATPGLTCPECGRAAKGERRLRRTRRPWRWALAAAGAWTMAAACAAMPRLLDGGWPRYVPAVALAAAWPWLPEGSEIQETTGMLFLNAPEPWNDGWRRRFLTWRLRTALRRSDRPALLDYTIGMLQPEDVDVETADRLLDLARHPSARVRIALLHRIGVLVPDPDRVVPVAVANLGDNDRTVVRGALNAIIAAGWDVPGGIEPPSELVELARTAADPFVRGHALTALAATRPTPEVMELLLAGSDDPEPRVRSFACIALAKLDPDRERAAAILLRARDDETLDVRLSALTAIARHGPYTAETLAAVARMSDEELRSLQGTGALSDLGGAALPLEMRLEVLGRAYATRANVWAVHAAAMRMSGEMPEVIRVLEEREARAEAKGDARTAQWCRVARSWYEAAERQQRTGDP